ncbi:MAG: YtpR family tRNA-binding protein [Bacilli bacterium]
MVNWVYQPTTLGDLLALYLQPNLTANRSIRHGDLVMIYHDQTLIGMNLYQPKTYLPALSSGILRRIEASWLETINALLKKAGVSEPLPPFHSGFSIGEITQVETHPHADQLLICQVNLGQKTIQVVTNSKKVKPLDKVVVALPGTLLNDGTFIQEGMMMQVASQGMFCSEKTLGISPETQVGVFVLPQNAIIGKDFYAQ